jgi:hypothetical protein
MPRNASVTLNAIPAKRRAATAAGMFLPLFVSRATGGCSRSRTATAFILPGMAGRSRVQPRVLLATMLLVLGVVATSTALATTKPVQTGIYSAKTAQGSSFTFKVVNCASTASERCLYSDTYPTVSARCPNGQTGGGLLNYPQGTISSNGTLNVVEGTIASGTYVKLALKFTGNRVSGTMRQLFPEQLGAARPACDSGTVVFTGHRAG